MKDKNKNKKAEMKSWEIIYKKVILKMQWKLLKI